MENLEESKSWNLDSCTLEKKNRKEFETFLRSKECEQNGILFLSSVRFQVVIFVKVNTQLCDIQGGL